tara:strand:+ start:32004 stop:32504 length:501 start_codon:yes stop_codon:yes gene_type:complete
MSGDKEFSTAKENLAHFEKLIDSYLTKQGIHNIQYNEEALKILNMKTFELKALTSIECGELSFALSQYALYVQQQLNEQTTRVNWAKSKIRSMVAKNSGSFDRYTKYEEKEGFVVQNNEYAAKLNDILCYAQAVLDRLSYMAGRIQSLSATLTELQRSKRRVDNVN